MVGRKVWTANCQSTKNSGLLPFLLKLLNLTRISSKNGSFWKLLRYVLKFFCHSFDPSLHLQWAPHLWSASLGPISAAFGTALESWTMAPQRVKKSDVKRPKFGYFNTSSNWKSFQLAEECKRSTWVCGISSSLPSASTSASALACDGKEKQQANPLKPFELQGALKDCPGSKQQV